MPEYVVEKSHRFFQNHIECMKKNMHQGVLSNVIKSKLISNPD